MHLKKSDHMPRFNKLLVLDIDETLIYSTKEKLDREPDYQVFQYFVYKRPNVDRFLQICLDWFEVGVWSSASEDYAQEIMSKLLGTPEKLSFLWSVSRCTQKIQSSGWFSDNLQVQAFLKDLKKLKDKGYKLENIIMVDDSPEKLQRNYGNGVIVKPYHGEAQDDELLKLLNYLENLGPAENIRNINKLDWRNNLINFKGSEKKLM